MLLYLFYYFDVYFILKVNITHGSPPQSSGDRGMLHQI